MTKKLTKRLTKKDDHEVDQETNQVDNDISKTDEVEKSKNMSLSDMIPYANMTLKKCGFKLSPTQSQTPKDGNCLAWSLSDQFFFFCYDYLGIVVFDRMHYYYAAHIFHCSFSES